MNMPVMWGGELLSSSGQASGPLTINKTATADSTNWPYSGNMTTDVIDRWPELLANGAAPIDEIIEPDIPMAPDTRKRKIKLRD